MELTHFNEQGRARMVDVSEKAVTYRTARAAGRVWMNPETLEKVRQGGMAKGDVLAVAQVAGIMAAKRTWELIPMCHPLPLTSIDITFAFRENALDIQAQVKCSGETGVEMEALTAVSAAALTVYFVSIYVGAAMGAEWALNNPTYVHMNSWFHYAKLYAATAGCIGFMMIKYKWGIGKQPWFRVFPFAIVAINILIAVCSDFESGIRGAMALAATGDRWWLSSENVWLYGGWWNWVNGIAGILNILCMTGWWGIYSSKKHDDMLWPDMTIYFIIAYDLWNFEYTYNNLPTHAWYCGLALLLAPTFANALWNKGGWIQNRANTLALWCMFAQVFPAFQDYSVFSTLPVLYSDGVMDATVRPTTANPTMQGVIAILALAANVIVLAIIIKRSVEQKKNPYKNEIFTDHRDYRQAMARAEVTR